MYSGARQIASTSSSKPSTSEVARYNLKPSEIGGSSKHPYRLNFYDKPPVEEITLEDFETWAIDRLRVLADIESGFARNRGYEEIKTLVESRCKTHLPLHSNGSRSTETDLERKKDQYGHFVLRLAFCRSEELRARFLKAESTLFKIRFETDDQADKKAFLDSMNFDWVVVDNAEKNELKKELSAASFIFGEAKFNEESFFKVHWTRVADLVQNRSVFVRKGWAYVPLKQQLSIVIAEFNSRLTKGLEMTARALPRLDEDDRLLPVLNHLSMGFMAGLSSEYVVENVDGEITAAMIKPMSTKHFPMCMRAMQDTLNSSHHLKFDGRRQYNMYLKGMGVPIDEALIFWRKSLSTLTDDKWNKEYKYAVRHNYGLEGSRKNYRPNGCREIITGTAPGPGQSHGCPFRHYSTENLTAALTTGYSLTSVETKEILASVKSQHYHLACTRLFEIQNKVEPGEGLGGGDNVDHPNKYFDASWKMEKEKLELNKVKAEGEPMDVE